jgi:sec-independent protein translocase protein TatA
VLHEHASHDGNVRSQNSSFVRHQLAIDDRTLSHLHTQKYPRDPDLPPPTPGSSQQPAGMGIPVVVPVAAAYSCSSSLAAPPRAAAAAARAPSRAHVAAAGMSSRASSFVGGSGGDLAAVAASVAARPRRAGSGGGGALGCKCLFGLGVPELAVIAGVAALVFGPKQLPEIGRSIGKTVKSFQQVRVGA